MEYLGMAIALFSILGFYTGLRIGYKVAKGNEPPKVNPVTLVKESIDRKKSEKKADEESEQWDALMNFNGFTPEENARVNGVRNDE
jgi:hypothetical protein